MAVTLIEAGAELGLLDDQERSPLNLARMLGHDEVIAALGNASSYSRVMDRFDSSEPIRPYRATH